MENETGRNGHGRSRIHCEEQVNGKGGGCTGSGYTLDDWSARGCGTFKCSPGHWAWSTSEKASNFMHHMQDAYTLFPRSKFI